MAFAGPFNRVGPQGPKGKNGIDGKDGRDGRDGVDGKNGKNGRDGKDGITTVVYQGAFGGGGTGGTTAPDETTTLTLSAGQTVVADSMALADFIAADYLINLTNADYSSARVQHLIVTRVNGDLEDSVYGRVGTNLKCELSTQIVGSNAELRVKNNEAFQIKLSFKRVILNY